MFNLQALIIAVIASFVVGSATSGYVTYKYETNKYERVISDAAKKQQEAITQVTLKALSNERKSTEITASLDRKYLEEHRKLGLVQDEFAKYRGSKHSGLHIVTSSCIPAGATNSGPSDTTGADPQANSGSAELSTITSEALESTARDADEMRARLQVAQDYAKAIEAQRERLSK